MAVARPLDSRSHDWGEDQGHMIGVKIKVFWVPNIGKYITLGSGQILSLNIILGSCNWDQGQLCLTISLQPIFDSKCFWTMIDS